MRAQARREWGLVVGRWGELRAQSPESRVQSPELKANRFVLVVISLLFTLSSLLAIQYTRNARVSAASTSTINFQARLLTAAGGVVPDGTYNVEFKLYDTAAAGTSAQGACSLNSSTDDCWWLDTRIGANKVTTKNGYLTVALGDTTAGGTAFGAGVPWDQELWLTLRIGGTGAPAWDAEMSPRMKVTAVPYAFAAKSAQSLKVTNGANSTTVSVDNPTGTRTINLPDASGTLAVSASGNIALNATTGNLTLTGQVPITNGGTNSNATPTAGAVAYGTGTAYGFTLAGTLGDCLKSAGGGTPTWGSCGGSTVFTQATGFAYQTTTTDGFVLGGTTVAAAKFYFNPATSGLYLGTNNTTNGSITLYSSGAVADPTIAADASGNLNLSATAGAVVIGDGSGDIQFQISNAADVLLANKSAALAAPYVGNDFTYSRTLSNGVNTNANGGNVFSVTDTSALVAGTASNYNLIYGNAAPTGGAAFSGNLMRLQTSGVDRFTVSAGGNVTAAGTLNISGASATIGTATSSNGSIVLNNVTNFPVTINATGKATNASTISFPTNAAATDTFCLVTLNNCVGTGVPTSRTLTINGTAQDLTANRTWNVGDMLLGTAQSVTATKTFNDSTLAMKATGANTGVTTIANANASATNYTATLQAATGTIAYLGNTTFIGTTSIALNRASAAQALTGITSIDGSAASLTTSRNIQGVAFNGTANIDIINGTGFVKATGTTLSYDNSTYIPLAPAAATTDTSTNPSIFINKTGASGNLLQLQQGAADRFTVSYGGNVTAAGTIQGTAATFTSANALTLGTASSINASIIFRQSTSANTVTLQAPSTAIAGSFTLNLPTTIGAANDCLKNGGTAGLLTFGTCGSATTLQGAYDADTDTGDTIVALTTADDSLIFRNPAASGTDSAQLLTIDQLNTGAKDALVINNAGTGNILNMQDAGTTVLKVVDGGHLLAANVATGTTGTSSGVGAANTTSITLAAAGAFANNDVIFVNNTGGSGQDYYARITAGGGTINLTVSPAVSYGTAAGYTGNATITKYTVQNIGATATDYTTQANRFFQGYFLGGVVTGAGSTTLSDGALNSTGNLVLQGTTGNVGIGTGTTAPGAKLEVKGGYTATYPTPGLTKGTVHINPDGVNDNSASITFGGGSGGTVQNSAQAGIYVQSSGAYGTRMSFATTDVYATGSKARVTIDSVGQLRIENTGTGRLTLAPNSGGTQNLWNIDNTGGTFRIFREDWAATGGGINGSVKMSITDAGDLTIGGQISCVQGYCPTSQAVRLTPNFHFNAVAGYAVILNWDNGAVAGTTQMLRVGNGSAADAFFVRADGQVHANTYIAGYGCADGQSFCASNWFRSNGNSGWFNATHTAGVYATTGSRVDLYPGNSLYSPAGIYTDGTLTVASPHSTFQASYQGGWCGNYCTVVSGNPNTNNSDVLRVESGHARTTSIDLLQLLIAGGQDMFRVDGDGNVFIRGVWHSNSDANLKKEITSTTDNLSKILQLQPVSYRWKDAADQSVKLGLIAQNVQTVFPELVATGTDGNLTLEYTAMVSPLIGAIQEQQAMIDQAKSDIQTLQGAAGLGAGNASFISLNVSGPTTLTDLVVNGNATFNGNLTVQNISVANITINGHIITAGNTPLITTGIAAGTGDILNNIPAPTATIDGNDTAGTITIVAGASTTNGVLAEVMFDTAFTAMPRINLTPLNKPTVLMPVYIEKSPNGFVLKSVDQITVGETYQFDYFVSQ